MEPLALLQAKLARHSVFHYYRGVIESFADKETAKVFEGRFSGKLPRDIQAAALRKMQMLDAMEDLQELGAVPGWRLEKLKGSRKGQWSIRINKQWRLCFRWDKPPPKITDIEICDYH